MSRDSPPEGSLVVGVDGCPRGWVAVTVRGRAVQDVRAFPAFGELIGHLLEARVIAVDIPIGLPETGPRRADLEARSLLGRRASSVFPTAPRAVLEAPDYATARAVARTRFARGISAQSYNLGSKILEVDRFARRDHRIIEVHPEVSFAALAGSPLPHPKKTWNGQMLRRWLLADAGLELPDDLGQAGAVPVDDVFDAAAAAWTAARHLRGESVSIPADPELDADGRPVAIWY